MEEFIVRYQRMAGYLMQQGFALKAIRPNANFPHLNVFVFRDRPEIREAVAEFTRLNKSECMKRA